MTLDQNDIEKQIAELKTNISNANAIAANDAAQKQESLNEAKQDQATTLAKATDSVNKAQASYDELVKKRDDCQTKLNNKKNELNTAGNARDTAKMNWILQKSYQDAQAEASADPTNADLLKRKQMMRAVFTNKNKNCIHHYVLIMKQ